MSRLNTLQARNQLFVTSTETLSHPINKLKHFKLTSLSNLTEVKWEYFSTLVTNPALHQWAAGQSRFTLPEISLYAANSTYNYKFFQL